MRTRSEARTDKGWAGFDRMAGLVSLALVLVLLAISLLRPGMGDSAGQAPSSTDQAPVGAAGPVGSGAQSGSGDPVASGGQAFDRIPTYIDPQQSGAESGEQGGQKRLANRDASLVVPILDLRASDGKLTIDGIVGSDQTRKAIVRAALERFGMRNITDRVAVSAGIGAFSWTSDPKDIMVLVGRPDRATSVRIDGNTVILTGTLTERADKEARGLAAQQLFGPSATIDNRIRVVSAEGAAPPAGASASIPGRIDLKGVGNPVRAGGSASVPAPVAAPAPVARVDSAPLSGSVDSRAGEPLEDGDTVMTAIVPEKITTSQCARIATGLVIPIRSGRAELTDDGREALKAVTPCLERRRYIVGGHTDSRGDADANMLLSQERAQAVVDYLVAAGVPAEQLVARGYGETRPVDTNRNEKGRARNRRIDFRFAD